MATSHSLHVRPGGLRALLLSDHNDRLELMLEEVMLEREHAHAGSLAVWKSFTKELAAHVEIEERWLLPAYAEAHATHAAHAAAAHADLRNLVTQVEKDSELKSRSATALVALQKRLRTHAYWDDQHLYPWAVEHLEHAAWNAVRSAMRTLMFNLPPNHEKDAS